LAYYIAGIKLTNQELKNKMNQYSLNEIKNKTLILTETNIESDPMFNAWIDAGVHAALLFSPVNNKVGRAFRRLWLNGIIPGANIWYGEWKNRLDKYDTVIVHASELTRTIPSWIRKQKKDIRIIYWYWNPVNNKSLPSLIKDDETELWSFDKADCEKYNMHKNIQYYYGANDVQDDEPEYDVYFVGHDKGRRDQIESIRQQLERDGVSYKFDIIKESEPNIPYYKVRDNIRKSKAILEINQAGQEGYTLRALEALFFQKKLITSNESIQKEDFYRKDNIYIISEGLEGICDFLRKPGTDTRDYIKLYDIDAWIGIFEGIDHLKTGGEV